MTWIALLRAVNVGGTGKLPMADLRALAEGCGFSAVRTYIASGNLLFESGEDEAEIKQSLEAALLAYGGRRVGVTVRSAEEMAAVAAANPFAEARPDRTVAVFLDDPPPPDLLAGASGQAEEEIASGEREIYIHYGQGMGRSKLKLPAAREGTARNMNTVATLAAMAGG